MKKIYALWASIAFALSGCTGVTTEDYKDKTPKLDIRKYLNGPVEAWGVLYGMSGKIEMQFTVDMVGTWTGNKGVLDEKFVFSDGRKDERKWTIEFQTDHQFTAAAHDVIGIAQGSQHGNAVNMNYTLRVKRDNGDTIDLNMDDWMFLIDEKTLLNRTKMRKYGFNVGELVIFFRKK